MVTDAKKFLSQTPILYHMAHAGAWPQIERHGLLSTNILMERLELTPAQREQLLVGRRRQSQSRFHPSFGTAVIRDQSVLNLSRLDSLLHSDTSTSEWLEMLNNRIFLWAKLSSLEGLLGARMYRKHAQTILTFHSKAIFDRYQQCIEVADINTGAILFPNAPKRGRSSFQRLENYQPGHRSIVEVTIPNGIPPEHLKEVLVSVVHREPDGTAHCLYSR